MRSVGMSLQNGPGKREKRKRRSIRTEKGKSEQVETVALNARKKEIRLKKKRKKV